jgi:hypothetical protein
VRTPHPSIHPRASTVAGTDAGFTRVKMFEIDRYDPNCANSRRRESFEVDLEECGPMVLDIYPLNHRPILERQVSMPGASDRSARRAF